MDPLGNEKMFGFLRTAMDASSMNHQVSASNLANIDTPGYKARKMDFEAILQDFQEQEAMQPPEMSAGNRSLPPSQPLNFKDYVVEQDTTHLTERFDGNNVNLEKEMAQMAKMRGRFQLASMFMTRKLKLLNETIMSR